jgi:hypothetical protein
MSDVPSFLLGRGGYAAVRSEARVRLLAAGFKRYDASYPYFEAGRRANYFLFFAGNPEEEPGPEGWFAFQAMDDHFEIAGDEVTIRDERGEQVVEIRELFK